MSKRWTTWFSDEV